MFTQHVSRQLSAYLHDELPTERTRAVAEHLIGCTQCRAAFEEIKLGYRLAQRLAAVAAPDSIWPGIEAGLSRHPDTKGLGARYLKPALAIAAGLALFFVAGFFWLRWNPVGSQTSWQVARLEGAPRIGATTVDEQGRLAVGQWLETDANSRARVDVSTIGNVEIDPNTRVRLVESKPTEHRLELARGRLSARISAPPKLFFVNTPSGVAEDLGCAYTLEVDDDGNSLLHVTTGWVSLQLTDRESTVPAGAACATRRGIGPGTPYFEDCSESFRAALTQLDFANDQSARAAALETVLREARARDAMTLLYLLARVNENERARVYDGMTALVPAPAGVTRAGMLNLDEQMMQRWKQMLALTWNTNTGPIGVWRKMWSRGVGKINGMQGKR
jgi:hypothetical protein